VLEQYLLRGNAYELAVKSGSGELRSQAIQGFCVPLRAFFDAAENLRVLRHLFVP